jgi:RNA polymerase sigma-70 factor, ECF subfamily
VGSAPRPQGLWVQRLAGDEEAFACIFRDVQPALLRYLRVISSEPDDIAGDTWLHVVAGLVRFRGDEQGFRAWLFTIARHRAIDRGRSRARYPAVPLDPSAEIWLTSPDAADLALETIATRRAVALVASLPRDQAEIVMLRVVAGLDVSDVARIAGKSPGAVFRLAPRRSCAPWSGLSPT